MSSKFKNIILNKLLVYFPVLILFISVFNEFDFNYLNYKYFSFNFPYLGRITVYNCCYKL